MIEQIFIVAFVVWAVYITMQEGMIFEKLGNWLEDKIKSEYWSKPVYSCVVCMSFWHGLYVYWLVFGYSWMNCLITIIGAVGLNAVITKLIPDDGKTNCRVNSK